MQHRSNVIGTLNLCDVAFIHKIHVTNFATGCIFEYDDNHPLGSGVGFKEEDTPNFTASFYSMTKGLVEKLLRFYPNVLTLRVRMPISDDLHPRNFITKISKYERVVNIPNSMTVLHDLLPVAIDMSEKEVLGIINFTNPGVISHNEILDLYKKVFVACMLYVSHSLVQYINPNFTYKNFSLEEQAKILKAGRSNNELVCYSHTISILVFSANFYLTGCLEVSYDVSVHTTYQRFNSWCVPAHGKRHEYSSTNQWKWGWKIVM